MKKFLFPLFLVGVLFLSGCDSKGSTILPTNSLSETRQGLNLNEDTSIITCNLSISTSIKSEPDSNGSYNKIEEKSAKQESPMQLTFVGIDTDKPIMKGNTDTVPLTKIDNGDTIYLIETTAIGNLALYTYFPKEKVIIMSKQYNLMGRLYAGQMMGFCN